MFWKCITDVEFTTMETNRNAQLESGDLIEQTCHTHSDKGGKHKKSNQTHSNNTVKHEGNNLFHYLKFQTDSYDYSIW